MLVGTGALLTKAASRTLPLTIRSLVEEAAKRNPQALALAAPGRQPGTYQDLLAAMDQAAGVFHSLGIGAGDPVAAVLGSGPETASLLLSIAAVAACAPLNPRYRDSEFEFYLSDLKPKAVVVERDVLTPAAELARKLGIPIIELSRPADRPCGNFVLEVRLPRAAQIAPPAATPSDTALLLHTSGTTSRPKLVRLTNANLCHSAYNIQQWLQLTSSDRCLNVMPLFHVHGLIGALLSSVAAGASVVCPPEFSAPDFFQWLAEFRPTWYTAAPTLHRAIVERSASNTGIIQASRMRFIRSCSSPLSPRLMAELEQVFQAPVLEAYGMTEAAHQIACNPLPPLRRKPGSVGIATGPEVAIVDTHGVAVGPYEAGDVVIRGPNVTPGYAGNPDANREVFVDGWFRTGDNGYLDQDGYLFLTGRTKETINRGGEKISTREIDEVLLDHPAVSQAMAFAVPDLRLGEDVAAAIVLRDGSAATEHELRQFASQRLADFKIPRRIVFVSEIPTGPSGKPQRIGAAAKLGLTAETSPAAFAPSASPNEKLICDIWLRVLVTDRCGVHDNFWHIGGDSLMATRMLTRLRESTGVDVPFVTLFDAPTPELLAAWIDANNTSGQKRTPFSPVPRLENVEIPLSYAQERMWFLAQLEGGRVPYVRAAGYYLRGPLDVPALERSLNRIVERHQVLRTTYRRSPYNRSQSAVVQVVNHAAPLSLKSVDLSGIDEPARTERLGEFARVQANQPFDLSSHPMLRASLVRLAPEEHCLLIAMHHIASDGWSTGVFLRELGILYEAYSAGTPPSLPELPMQYAQYAVWGRSPANRENIEAGLSYWKRQLAGLPASLPLPVDRPRTARQTFRGARETLLLPAALAAAIESLSREQNTTLFMTLLAAFQALLHRYTGSDDIAVGCPVANRAEPEMEDLIGLFANIVVMRTDFSSAPTFRELLARVRATAIAAYAHQGTPFEKVVEALQPVRTLALPPLFQVMFQVRNFNHAILRLGALQVEPFDFDPGVAQFDLTFEIQPSGDTLACVLEYNRDLFEASTAQRMLANYGALLEVAAHQPATAIRDTPFLATAERAQVLSQPPRIGKSISSVPAAPEETVCRLLTMWEQLLGKEGIGIHDNFFDLGGRSLQTAELAARVQEEFGAAIAIANIFDAPTVAQLARMIDGQRSPSYPPHILPVQATGSAPPFFCLGPAARFATLAQQLGPEQPFFAVTLYNSDRDLVASVETVEEIAGELVRSIRKLQPNGPYYLGGYSLQGLFALELARELRAQGEDIAALIVIDTFLPSTARPRLGLIEACLRSIFRQALGLQFETALSSARELYQMLVSVPLEVLRGFHPPYAAPVVPTVRELLLATAAKYRPQPYDGPITFIEAANQPVATEVGSRFGWAKLAAGGLDIRTVPGEHLAIIDEPYAAALAAELSESLRAARNCRQNQEDPPMRSRAANN